MHCSVIQFALYLFSDTHTHARTHTCTSQGLTHRPFTSQQVKGGDKIDLGQGHVMEFVMAPNLHWCVCFLFAPCL